MRESFAVLDRNNIGSIAPSDVAQQLAELGLDSSSQALSGYFPDGGSSINLAFYLSLLAGDLPSLSRQEELLAAFSAFDDDDSGQIDVDELKDALMHTMPEPGSGDRPLTEREVEVCIEGFVGRRMFKKGSVASNAGLGTKKDVFRYGDFVAGIWGGNGDGTQQVVPH
jgi:Ca2+-binding EF-hand superfamily protein